METRYFTVIQIDGDYAYLKRTDKEEPKLTMVARALLPEEIVDGTKLKCEFLQYEIVE